MSHSLKVFITIVGIALIAVLGYIAYKDYFTKPAPSTDFIVEKGNTEVANDQKKSNFIGSPTASTRLTFAVHWLEQIQLEGIYENNALKTKGLRQYLEEYVGLNPNVAFQILPISYQDYADKLQVLSDADSAPDIYQIYSPWGVSYVKNGILDTPPSDVIEDVSKNYVSNSGAIIDGKIWGFPTEVNTYALLYNKDVFKELGITAPPRTWKELVDIAVRATKKDDKGNITRYGIAFLKGNDWQMVDPFLSLLFSNGGAFISADGTRALFNSPEGVEALTAELELFKRGATNIDGNFFDFSAEKVAMVISPPWVKNSIKEKLRDRFYDVVGIAPLPILKKQSALRYSWFMGVMEKSKQKAEAWDFLKWFMTEVQPSTGTTRYGDLLVYNIGAIPGRTVDVKNHSILSEDPFTKIFVNELANGVSEPNIGNISAIKSALMSEIEAAFAGAKTAKGALDAAATKVNTILSGNK